jgi:hypothetical protein
MKYQPLDLANKLDLLDAPWGPRVIAEINDSRFEPARIRGDLPRQGRI